MALQLEQVLPPGPASQGVLSPCSSPNSSDSSCHGSWCLALSRLDLSTPSVPYYRSLRTFTYKFFFTKRNFSTFQKCPPTAPQSTRSRRRFTRSRYRRRRPDLVLSLASPFLSVIGLSSPPRRWLLLSPPLRHHPFLPRRAGQKIEALGTGNELLGGGRTGSACADEANELGASAASYTEGSTTSPELIQELAWA